MQYPALIQPDDDGFMVSFRDIPEALTGAPTREEAMVAAAGALLDAMDFYFEDQRPVPSPSPAVGDEVLVALPVSASAKVLLLNEMLRQKVGPSELARRMGLPRQEMTRITSLDVTTKIDRIADALRALGRQLDVTVT